MKYTVIDEKNYLILSEIISDKITYIYLVNLNDEEDFCIKKEINNNLEDLDSKEEFDKALKLFTQKYEQCFEYKKVTGIK